MMALSSFSLDHSMQEWPEEEMQNVVGLITSDGIEQHIRWEQGKALNHNLQMAKSTLGVHFKEIISRQKEGDPTRLKKRQKIGKRETKT